MDRSYPMPGDIEQNIGSIDVDAHQGSSSPSNSSSDISNIVSIDDDDDDDDDIAIDHDHTSNSNTSRPSDGRELSRWAACMMILGCLILFIPAMLLIIIYQMLCCACLSDDDEDSTDAAEAGSKGDLQAARTLRRGVYRKMKEFIPNKLKLRRLKLVVAGRLAFVSAVWLALNLSIPRLRKAVLLGSLLWKWSLLPTMFTSGFLYTICIVLFFKECIVEALSLMDEESSAAFYFIEGLMYSVSSLLYFTGVFLAWMLYFRTHQGLSPSAFVDKYAMWTLVSLIVGATLWVLKNAVLLNWKAKAILERFKERILKAGFQLFFLSTIIEGLSDQRFLLPWKTNWAKEQIHQEHISSSTLSTHPPERPTTKTVQECITTSTVSTHKIKKVAQKLMDLAQVTLREDDDVSDIIKKYRHKIRANNNDGPSHSESMKAGPSSPQRSADAPAALTGSRSHQGRDGDDDPALGTPPSLTSTQKSEAAGDGGDKPAEIPNVQMKAAVFRYWFTKGRPQPDESCQVRCKFCPTEYNHPKGGDYDNYTRHIRNKHPKKVSMARIGNGERVTEEEIQKWISKEEAELLIKQLQAEFPSKPIKEVSFLKWMVGAHKNCLSLGYTLIDAFGVAKVLDKVLTCCVVGIVILFWLIATGLATTKVLVVIATQFVAVTFMFGDTCKTLFQGVIFSFVTHPFDVGDRCIIDEVEVEVKRIGIMMTTCVKIGTNEKLLYPTSNLATKLILNLESKPDPADTIELVLSSTTTRSQIVHLRRCIREFLHNDDQRVFYEKSCKVIVKEIGSNIKMSIHFKHTLNVQDVSHSQFIAKKNRGRSKFLIKIKRFMEELEVTVPQS